MKILVIFLIFFVNNSLAQNIKESNDCVHSIKFGYGENFNYKDIRKGLITIKNLAYAFKHDNLKLKFTYFNVRFLKDFPQAEDSESNLYIPQVENDFKYFGFSLGLMIIKNIKGDAPDEYALPIAGIKIGIISKYYISFNFFNEQSLPFISVNFNYKLNDSFSYLYLGRKYMDRDWFYNSEIQIDYLKTFFVNFNGLYNFRKNYGFYYGSLGLYYAF